MKRVLVVDDDPYAATSLAELLRMDGYDAVALSNSRTAVERMARERFDAVVTDLEMPGVHGVEVVQAAHRGGDGVVVLVVTAYGDSPASKAALDAGAARIFPKPLAYEALIEDLAKRLESA